MKLPLFLLTSPFSLRLCAFVPVACCLLASCVAFKHGDVYFGAVGTDADEVDIPGHIKIKGMNNSRAFDRAATMVEKMWNAYLMKEALVFVAGRYYTHQGRLVDSNTTVKLQELKNAASEAEAASKIKELEALKALEGA